MEHPCLLTAMLFNIDYLGNNCLPPICLSAIVYIANIGFQYPAKEKQGHRHKSRALVRENVKTCENL